MRLASFSFEDRERVGVIVDDEVVDLYLAAAGTPRPICASSWRRAQKRG